MEQIDLDESEANLKMLNTFYNECRCDICKLLFESPITITCGHSFCRQCIAKFIIQKPQCPQCLQELNNYRYPIFSDVEHLQENILIKSISNEIGQLFITQKSTKEKQKQNTQPKLHPQPQPNVNNQKQLLSHQSYIVLYSKSPLLPYVQQTIPLEVQQFKGVDQYQLLKMLKFGNIVLLCNPPKNNQPIELGYLSTIKGVQRDNSNLILNIMIQEILQIGSFSIESFSVSNVPLNFPIAKGKILVEDKIEFNEETDSMIQTLLNSIHQSLVIHMPLDVNSVTSQSIVVYISSLGIIQALKHPDIKRNYKTLKQLSYIIPSILQLNEVDSRKIASTHEVIERLIFISKLLEKFQTITNPLMVFKLPGHQNKISYKTELIIICIVVFAAFYYRIFGI